MTRESFVFYRSFYEAAKDLPEEVQVSFFHALCEYALNGKQPALEGVAKAMFIVVKPQIDANNKRYKDGKKGGRPPKNKTDVVIETETYGYEDKKPMVIETDNQPLTETEPNVNVNVNDNVNDNENVNDNVISETSSPVTSETSSISIISEEKQSVTKKPTPSGETKKRQSLKDQLTEYVNSLDYSEETKQSLFKWIFQIGLNGKVSVDQLRSKLETIWNTYDDETLVRESIDEAYRNNWFGFFPLKNSRPQIQQKPVIERPSYNPVQQKKVVKVDLAEAF